MYNQENSYGNGYNDHQKEIALIIEQILPTNTIGKCMMTSKKNLYFNIGT